MTRFVATTFTKDAAVPTLDPTTRPGSLRVSDAEREQVAARVRDAAAVGMLTLAEADERQAAAYAARIRADLAELTGDLPAAQTRQSDLSGPLAPRVRRRLAAHAAVAVLLAAERDQPPPRRSRVTAGLVVDVWCRRLLAEP